MDCFPFSQHLVSFLAFRIILFSTTTQLSVNIKEALKRKVSVVQHPISLSCCYQFQSKYHYQLSNLFLYISPVLFPSWPGHIRIHHYPKPIAHPNLIEQLHDLHSLIIALNCVIKLCWALPLLCYMYLTRLLNGVLSVR